MLKGTIAMNRILALLVALSLLLPLCVFAEDTEVSELDLSVDGKFRQFQSRCGTLGNTFTWKAKIPSLQPAPASKKPVSLPGC